MISSVYTASWLQHCCKFGTWAWASPPATPAGCWWTPGDLTSLTGLWWADVVQVACLHHLLMNMLWGLDPSSTFQGSFLRLISCKPNTCQWILEWPVVKQYVYQCPEPGELCHQYHHLSMAWHFNYSTVQYSIQTINQTGITVLNCSTVTKTTVGQCSQLSHWLCKPLGAVSTNIVRVWIQRPCWSR